MLRRIFLTAVALPAFWAVSAAGACAQDIVVTSIPNEPFSGTIEEQHSFIVADGTVATTKTMRMIARDSQGRTREESRGIELTGTPVPPLVSVRIYDPQTRIFTWLDVQRQRYWTMVAATEPPELRDASSAGVTLPLSDYTKGRDLGTREMEGLVVHGVRETQMIPANAGGGGKAAVTDDYWYSDDLCIDLEIEHHDPRFGSATLKVTQVSQEEPDPALFEIPEGYRDARGSAVQTPASQNSSR